MSNSKLSKKTIKIAGATSIAIFTLVAVFTATIAWFSLNHTIESTGMSLKISNESGCLSSIDIYEFRKTLNKDVEDPITHQTVQKKFYSFKSTPTATLIYNYTGTGAGVSPFPMGDYTPLEPDHPLLLVFNLTAQYTSTVSGDITISGYTDVGGEDLSGFLGAIDDHGLPVYNLDNKTPTLRNGTKTISVDGADKTVGIYPLSSVVNFKCASYTNSDFNKLKVSDSEGSHLDIMDGSIALKDSFVNSGVGSSITFDNEPTIFTSSGSGTFDCIAMMVNYDVSAIATIYSTYLGNDILEVDYGGALCFYCDWSLEVY